MGFPSDEGGKVEACSDQVPIGSSVLDRHLQFWLWVQRTKGLVTERHMLYDTYYVSKDFSRVFVIRFEGLVRYYLLVSLC